MRIRTRSADVKEKINSPVLREGIYTNMELSTDISNHHVVRSSGNLMSARTNLMT